MAKSKLVVADPKIGKSTMYELTDDQFRIFKGLKIGSTLDGSSVSIEGSIKITGGSDHSGFPMRNDVLGGAKKYVLLTNGVGFRTKEKGLKRRKLVRGNTITDDIYQINAILTSAPEKETSTVLSKKEVTDKEDTHEKLSETNVILSTKEETNNISPSKKSSISIEKSA